MFSSPNTTSITILEGEYSVTVVILSIIIACLASYTAIIMNQRVKQNLFFNKHFYMMLASFAMGLGIWSMHFIGMSAFMLPASMKYNVFLTVLSAIPAVFASYIAFFFANRLNKNHGLYVFTGIVMGLGIAAMHYIGMAAMEMEVKYYYKPWIFIASIAIAIVVSYVALFILSALRQRNHFINILVSILMGLAVTSMHYTGMYAVVFYVEGELEHHTHAMHAMDMKLLIYVVTAGILLLFFLTGLTSMLGRYADYRLTYFDALTKFPNQRQFEKDLNNLRVAGSLAIVHIDQLEKWVSAYGYSFGDEIVRSIGDELQILNTSTTKVYRIEGNRFAMISSNDNGYRSMKRLIEGILSTFKEPIKIDNHQIKIDMICAMTHSNNKTGAEELFSNSLAVLQHPTTKYNHEVVEYDPEIHTFSLERQIEQDINSAMENNDLFIVYQPKVYSNTKEISGLEALLRWVHPKHGFISPGVFVPILEEKGRIFDVTDWVIERVCEQIAQFLKQGVPFSHVSVNIPGPYITSPELLNIIEENLTKYNIDSQYLELEITETSVIHNIENAMTALSNYKEIDIGVALDDFGTGLSSLSYLKMMPVSTIKIDKSFVDGVPLSDKDSAVLKAIVRLCDSLNLKVVIEGVETEEQYHFITSFTENAHIQGYYFSRPLKVDELLAWIAEREKTLIS
nr:EAL domain-containing protein [Lysinibacillus timonensis]